MTRVREWKPGDVARTKAGGTIARTAVGSWVLLDDGHGINIEDDRISRPLVVIDPEDREQVERLTNALLSKVNDRVLPLGLDLAQAALREFANPTPPKPEEPTRIAAAVEDSRGVIYLRTEVEDYFPWMRVGVGSRQRYADIDAVKVLSDGIPA